MPIWRGTPVSPRRASSAGASTAARRPEAPPAEPAAASLSAAAVLEAAPPAAVAALAQSLGVAAEDLAGLLPPEDLAAALETVQLQAIEQEGQQAQQGQQGEQGQQGQQMQQEQQGQQGQDQQGLLVAPASAGNGFSAAEPEGGGMRIVGGDGSWVCSCGEFNTMARQPNRSGRRGAGRLLLRCQGCPQAGPCRCVRVCA